MSKKPMSKKTAIIVLAIVIAAAIFLGFLFLNKSDGPVMGMLLADKPVKDIDAYTDVEKTPGDGIYQVVSPAFNKYNVDYESDIPQGEDLYATVHFVECLKGTEYTARWLKDGEVINEEKEALTTEPTGVISYMLEAESVSGGSYTIEIYDGDRKIFEYAFLVE